MFGDSPRGMTYLAYHYCGAWFHEVGELALHRKTAEYLEKRKEQVDPRRFLHHHEYAHPHLQNATPFGAAHLALIAPRQWETSLRAPALPMHRPAALIFP